MARAPAKPTVWTTGRKWVGNLVPLAFWLPPTAFGLIRMAMRSEIEPVGVGAVGLGVVLGWLATNWFGSAANGAMRRQLGRILQVQGEAVPDDAWFVGFATPKFSSALDPHEDVGFLVLGSSLRFLSETRSLEIAKADVTGVRFRFNVHTLVGLGRWVSVEGVVSGRPVRLLLEPRTRRTMLGNLREARRLRREIAAWVRASVYTP